MPALLLSDAGILLIYNSIKNRIKKENKKNKKTFKKVLTNKKVCAIMGKLSHERGIKT